MQADHSPDGAFMPPSEPLHRDNGSRTEFERAIMEQIDSIGETVNMLASTVESIELKLDEFIQIRGGKPRPDPKQHNRTNPNWSAPLPEPQPPDSVLNVYEHEDSAAFLSLTSEQRPPRESQSEKLLANALNKILVSLPSQCDGVDNVYEEIKLFVALTMNLITGITPQGIISRALMPYLLMTTGRSPSLLHRIWNDMSAVTGCNEDEIRRTFKRMIDTHCRGFRRKMMSLEQFPASILHVTKWVKTNVLNQVDDHQLNSD